MTSPASVSTEEMVRELWDRQQITNVMLRFGRGLDLHDWDMYAATLTDPFVAPTAEGGVIERCGHWAAEERPDFVADIVRDLASV